LVNLFSTHDIERYYEAICLGAKLPPKKTLESTIGRSPHNRLKMAAKVKGKNAITHMKALEFLNLLVMLN
jgi:23S rRNA pseudouridine1911/1915/1917 synthase